MRILIAGFGTIARRHLKNIRQIEPASHLTIWRQHTSSEDAEARALAETQVFSVEEALRGRPDAALVTGPASSHMATGLILAKAGIPLFIEKPLSHTMAGVDTLLNVCRANGVPLMVGYNFRFHQPLQILRSALIEGSIGRPLYLHAEVGQYLPDWRPHKDYRLTASAKKELGGGAVLELSHELDCARWLMGEVASVQATMAKVSDLEIDVEDTAQITLRFRNGAIGSVHMNMVQRVPTRTCRIVGAEGTFVWDAMASCVSRYLVSNKTWEILHSEPNADRNQMYVEEMRHFLECAKTRCTPLITGEDGKAVLEVALAAKRSAEDGQMITL